MSSQEIRKLLDAINIRVKKIKADVPAYLLSDVVEDYAGSKIPTGIPKIDKLLCGGMPRSKIVEFFGPESSGKTTLALAVIAGAQRKNANCGAIIIDAEHALDLEYAKRIGVDPSRVIIQQPDYGEQALELVKQSCLAKTDSNLATDIIIVVDSVAALVPKSEFEEDQIGDSGGIGGQARMMSQAMRQLLKPISDSNACAMFINQIRENIGNTYNPTTTPGGRALKFYASLRLKISKIGKWEQGDGIKSKIEVVKSKLFPPFNSTEVNIGPSGIDAWLDFVVDAIESGVITKSGAWVKYEGTNIGQGLLGAKDYIIKNPEVAKAIAAKIQEKVTNAVKLDTPLAVA